MATLFNTKISATYEGLFKTIDNAAITASLKELTDGSGNQSGLYVNNAGDFKVSNILEWGSLKDTGTGVTITRYVTSTDGIENFDNNTSLPTSAAVKLYVDSKFATSDTLQEVLSFGNTTGGNDIVVSASDDITFTDSSKILMGAGSDLEIYHDGSNSYIKELGTGQLYILAQNFRLKSADGLESLITANVGGAVSLYYGNTNRLQTTNAGASVTGNLVVSGTITGAGGSFLPLAGGTMTGNTLHGDSVKSLYGTGNDLEVYHDGTDSIIADTGTGNLYIRAADQLRLQGINESNMLIANQGGSVNLYHNNVEKFSTNASGVSVTGALSTTTDVTVGANATFVDNGKAIFGAGSDLQVYHNGSHSYIQDTGTGELRVTASTFSLRNSGDTDLLMTAYENGAVNLYFDGTKRIETVTAGAKVTGNLEVTGTITGSGGSFLPLAGGTMTGDTIHNDNVKSIYGTSGDGLEIYHDGIHSYIEDTGTGDLKLQASNDIFLLDGSGNVMIEASEGGSVDLFYSGSKKFATTSTGISVTGNAALSTGFSIVDDQYGKFGNNDDLIIGHGGSSIVRNLSGDLYIDQAAVTQSIFFRVSNANALDTTALTINREGDLTTGADVTIAGNLTVNGTTTTINTQTLAVEDPLIELSKDNAANSVDIGFYGKYNDGTARYLGLFSDASDSNKFRLFKGTTVQPTTTVNIAGLGYVAADLVVAGLEATTATFDGDVNITNHKLQITSSTPEIILSVPAGGLDSRIYNDGSGNFIIGNGTNSATPTTALTIDSSQNTTLAGTLEASSYKIAGTTILSGASSVVVGSGGGTGNVTLRTTGGNVLVVDSSANTTLAGNLTLSQGSVTIDDDTPYGGLFIEGGNAPGITIKDETLATCKAGIFQQSTTGNEGRLLIQSDIDNTGANSTIEMSVDGSNALVLNSSQNATFSGNINLAATKQLFFDGGGNTYITEDTADRLRFFTGGAEFMRFTESTTNITNFFTNINSASQIQLINSNSISPELKFNNGTVIAGIDYTDTANLRFIDRTNSRESVVINLGTGLITARNSSNTIKTQINQAGDSYFNGGDIGFGTETPIGNFNIDGGTGDSTAEDVVQTFTRTSSTGNVLAAKLRLVEGASTTHGDLKFQVKTTASSAEDLAYYTDAITIKGNSANVGIGTNSPNNLLNLQKNVAGGDVAAYIQNFNADAGSTDETASVIFAHGNDGDVGYVGGKVVCGKEGDFETSIPNIKGNLQFYTASGTSLDSDVNNIERMRIDSSGKVTIGTGVINPSIGSDIAITQGAIGIRINDAASAISPTTATSNNDNAVDLGVSNIRFKDLYMGGNGTFGSSVKAISYTGNAYPFNGEFLGGADVASANLQAGSTSGFETGVKVYGGGNATPNIITMMTASTERMRIDSTGLVEIKNTTPTLRLTNTQDPLGNGTVGVLEFFTNDSSTGATRTVSSIVCDNQAGSSVPGGDLVFKTSLGGSGSPVATEKLRIKDTGTIDIAAKDLIIDDVNEHRENFIATGNAAVTFDIDMKNVSASGQPFEVFVGFTHYADTYGAMLHQAFYQRSTVQSDITLVHTYINQTSTFGGAWSVSYVDATTIRISKSAGTHASSGHGYLRVTQIKP